MRLVAAVLLVISCVPPVGAGGGAPAPSGRGTSLALQVPGTYTTRHSCGEELGDEVLLTLLENQLFTLRQVYRDPACAHQMTVVFLGRWSVASNGRRLTLDTGPLWLRRFDIVDQHSLRIIDPPPPEPSRAGVYQTTHRTRLLPFKEPFNLRGFVLPGYPSSFPLVGPD